MATAEGAFKQEMPPEGGYRKLAFDRVLPQKWFTTWRLFLLNTVPAMAFLLLHRVDRKRANIRDIEDYSANIALQPILDAEMDREFLRQLRKNREDEEELMKNVPEWEVGKFFDEPIFKTIPTDWMVKPSLTEYYIHTRYKYLSEFFHFRHTR